MLVTSYAVDQELVKAGLEACPMPAGVTCRVIGRRTLEGWRIQLTVGTVLRGRQRMMVVEAELGAWKRIKGEAVELLLDVWREERQASNRAAKIV